MKSSCAILSSSPLAYAFYTFFKYTATYSSFLKICSSFSGETGQGRSCWGEELDAFRTSASISHGVEGVYGRMSQADAGWARVISWILFQEVG